MQRRRILWLCSWYPNRLEPFNGDFIQRHARAAALYHDIHVIHLAPDTAIRKTEQVIGRQDGLTEQLIYYPKSRTPVGRVRAHLRWKKTYRKAVEEYIRQQGAPDLVHVQVPVKAGLIARWIERHYGIRYLVTEHWGGYNDILRDNYPNKPAWFRHLTKKIFRDAAAFLSVSRFVGEGVRNLVVDRDYTVVPNVADTSMFHPSTTPGGWFRFIHVSNMVPLKNVEGILRAFRAIAGEFPEAGLQMVGDTDPSIRAYAKSLGLEGNRVAFAGEVPYAEVAQHMRRADCLVLNSDIENSPCVIGEALCCGLPVIATRTGGIPELVEEANSRLVPVRDDDALAEAMRAMVLGRNGYDRAAIAAKAHERFSYEQVGRRIAELYGSLIP